MEQNESVEKTAETTTEATPTVQQPNATETLILNLKKQLEAEKNARMEAESRERQLASLMTNMTVSKPQEQHVENLDDLTKTIFG